MNKNEWLVVERKKFWNIKKIPTQEKIFFFCIVINFELQLFFFTSYCTATDQKFRISSFFLFFIFFKFTKQSKIFFSKSTICMLLTVITAICIVILSLVRQTFGWRKFLSLNNHFSISEIDDKLRKEKKSKRQKNTKDKLLICNSLKMVSYSRYSSFIFFFHFLCCYRKKEFCLTCNV